VSAPPQTTTEALIEGYEAMLLDAYGVLVDGGGALPGAARLIERLEAAGRPWLVVTNDASRLPPTCGARYRALGLPIPDDRVLTSGSLIGPHLRARGLEGAPCLVLGPPDSHAYVRDAGAVPVGPDDVDFDATGAVVIGDESGFDTLPGLDTALSLAFSRRDRDLPLELVLPNPDLVYPKRPGHFGLAAGSLAETLERALELRYPSDARNRFTRLGKPHRAIFDAAVERLGTRRVVMVGDQPATDVAGARAADLDVALLTGGVGRPDARHPAPTYLLAQL
jgi:HAD superfamily hydrolase (TIGR01450 family)